MKQGHNQQRERRTRDEREQTKIHTSRTQDVFVGMSEGSVGELRQTDGRLIHSTYLNYCLYEENTEIHVYTESYFQTAHAGQTASKIPPSPSKSIFAITFLFHSALSTFHITNYRNKSMEEMISQYPTKYTTNRDCQVGNAASVSHSII